jgi:hypothetical protein
MEPQMPVSPTLSPAGQALFSFGRAGVQSSTYGNLGGLGDLLNRQVGDETEEEKLRKRLGMSATQSPAAQALLGGLFGNAGAGEPR